MTEESITITKESRLENVKLETENRNILLRYIPIENITDLKNVIYARAKFVSDKREIPMRNLKEKLDGNLDWRNKLKRFWKMQESKRKRKHIWSETSEEKEIQPKRKESS